MSADAKHVLAGWRGEKEFAVRLPLQGEAARLACRLARVAEVDAARIAGRRRYPLTETEARQIAAAFSPPDALPGDVQAWQLVIEERAGR